MHFSINFRSRWHKVARGRCDKLWAAFTLVSNMRFATLPITNFFLLFGLYCIGEFNTISTMKRYTVDQSIYIMNTNFENGSSVRATYRRIREYSSERNLPLESMKDNKTKKGNVQLVRWIHKCLLETVHKIWHQQNFNRANLKKERHTHKNQLRKQLKPANQGQPPSLTFGSYKKDRAQWFFK